MDCEKKLITCYFLQIIEVVEEVSNLNIESDFDENGEPIFPNNELASLDEMVNRPKWVIPVLPNGELEVLIDASIKLAKKGKLILCLHFLLRSCFNFITKQIFSLIWKH